MAEQSRAGKAGGLLMTIAGAGLVLAVLLVIVAVVLAPARPTVHIRVPVTTQPAVCRCGDRPPPPQSRCTAC